MVQVILGAGGSIGKLLAKELKQYTETVRLVSRNPAQVNGDDDLVAADLRDAAAVEKAVTGAAVAYLVVGLKYDRRVWKRDWPVIIRNVVDACLNQGVKLVFFDNVYLYDVAEIPHMTERSVVNPPSKKGKVRSEVVRIIQDAIVQRGLQALIARSADFYGPGASNGILNSLVLTPVKAGKKPNWQADPHKVHSFTYTVDAAKATAMLGNAETAYGQVWHLPTSAERWTGAQFIAEACRIKGVKPSYNVLQPFLITIGGLFNRTILELGEMQYQNDRDYFFDSQKFIDAFDFQPTGYQEGMQVVFTAD